MNEKPEENSSASERREYIWREIKDDKQAVVPFSTIVEKFGRVSEQTLHNDAKAFRRAGKPISIDNKAFVFDLVFSDTLPVRRQREKRFKRDIGSAGALLVVQGHLPTETSATSSLKLKLGELSRKSNRLLAIDAGSTMEMIAEALSTVKIPSRHLNSLRVLTNSAGISRIIQAGDSQLGVILTGGSLRLETDAMCGILTERNLTAMHVEADIGIIGASSLDRNMMFSCNHEDEAAIKSRLLELSYIKCIALDSTKIVKQSRSATWGFARLSSGDIDIVITDHGIHKEIARDERETNRQEFLRFVAETEVTLLVAPPIAPLRT